MHGVDASLTAPAHWSDRLAGWRVLAVHDFRLLWFGKGLAFFGDQCYLVLLPWLTLQLTDSGLALGAVLVAAGVPRAACMLLGGALIDRISPRYMLRLSTALRVLAAGALAGLVAFDALRLWQLYLFAATFGLLDAFFLPASLAIVPHIVPDERLAPANALIEGIAQAGALIGPVLTGFVLASFGPAIACALSAAILLGAVVLLAFIQGGGRTAILEPTPAMLRLSGPSGLAAATRVILQAGWRDPIVRAVLLLGAILNFLITGPLSVGLPALAHSRMPDGAADLGIMLSALAGGALLGTAGAVVLPQSRRRGRVLPGIVGAIGLSLVVLAGNVGVAQAAAVLGVMGMAMGLGNVLVITWLQQRTAPDLRGRVLSLLLFSTLLLAPLSNALAGIVVDVDVTLLFVTAGGGLLLTALVAALNRDLRSMA